MIHLYIKAMMLFLSLTFSNLAFCANVWVYDQEINKVRVTNTGNFIIYLTATADPICQSTGRLFYVYVNENGVSSEGAKALLSVAMTASAANRSIDIRYDNASNSCYVREIILNK